MTGAPSGRPVDPSPATDPRRPVVLFDGVCNLCNGAVRWIIERDAEGVFRFAPLQSEAARNLVGVGGRAMDGPAGGSGPESRGERPAGAVAAAPGSLVLVDEAGVHFRSTAALRIARRLGLPWSLLAAGLVVPRFLRDAVYRWVARNRYRWFGRREACMVPTPELEERFLDWGE